MWCFLLASLVRSLPKNLWKQNNNTNLWNLPRIKKMRAFCCLLLLPFINTLWVLLMWVWISFLLPPWTHHSCFSCVLLMYVCVCICWIWFQSTAHELIPSITNNRKKNPKKKHMSKFVSSNKTQLFWILKLPNTKTK